MTEPDNKNFSEESIEDLVSFPVEQNVPRLKPLFTTRKVRKNVAQKLVKESSESDEAAATNKYVRKYIKTSSKKANGVSKGTKKESAQSAAAGQKLDAFFHLTGQSKTGATLPIPDDSVREAMEIEGIESEQLLNQTMEEKKISIESRSPFKSKAVSAPEQPLDPMVSLPLSNLRSKPSSSEERSLLNNFQLFWKRV